jgi:hypothetical protein
MAWRFRRSVRGPLGLRINFSRSGIGLSEGVRGFRLGRDARGKVYSQTSIPGTGIYRRDYAKANGSRPPGQPDPRSRPSTASSIIALLLVLGAIAAVVLAKVLSHH